MNFLKVLFLKIFIKIKFKVLSLFNIELINEKCLNLQDEINPNVATKNFNKLLAFYGMNHTAFLNYNENIWKNILLFFFCANLIRVVTFYYLNPDKNYRLCIYVGHFTLLFESLRKFLVILLILFVSYVIHVKFLFNYNSNTKWHELFKCLDGSLSPESIGIKDKKILKKILILTKIVFKSIHTFTVGFILISSSFCLYLVLRRIRVYYNFEIISFLFWFSLTIFTSYFSVGIIVLSNFCYVIICFYCLINNRYYNKKITSFKIELSFGWRRIIMNMKLKHLFKQQIQFTIRILKYNQFWRYFYLIKMILLIPAHIFSLQQILFGHLNMQLRILYIICCLYITIFVLLSSLIACQLNTDMKIHSRNLIQLQLNPYLNIDINTSLKVS